MSLSLCLGEIENILHDGAKTQNPKPQLGFYG